MQYFLRIIGSWDEERGTSPDILMNCMPDYYQPLVKEPSLIGSQYGLPHVPTIICAPHSIYVTSEEDFFSQTTYLFLHPDEGAEAGLPRVHVQVHLVAPHLEALLDPQRVQCERTKVANALVLAGGQEALMMEVLTFICFIVGTIQSKLIPHRRMRRTAAGCRAPTRARRCS